MKEVLKDFCRGFRFVIWGAIIAGFIAVGIFAFLCISKMSGLKCITVAVFGISYIFAGLLLIYLIGSIKNK